MIIKPMDSLGSRKLELEILRSISLPPEKHFLVEQEWKRLLSGEKGEKNTAYLLDFYLDDMKNWMLIHDLRIEYQGKVAQIDHLIVTRALDIYILETKAYGDKLHISDDGSFTASYGRKEFAVPSPLEQNKRHTYVLEKALKPLLPKRLGVELKPHIEEYVLIDEKTILKRSKYFDSSKVVKAEQFLSMLDVKYKEMGMGEVLHKATKLISQASVLKLTKNISQLHTKSTTNYKERFGISDADIKSAKQPKTGRKATTAKGCAKCDSHLSVKNISYCQQFNQRFKNNVYCFNCQKDFPQ